MRDQLPPGWVIARLELLVRPDGLMTDGDWVESKDQDPNGEVRLIQLADIGNGSFLDKSNRFLTLAKAEDLNCTFLNRGDILISRLGEPLGKTCLFPGLDQPCVTVVDVHVVRPCSSDVSREWLMHQLNSAPVRKVIESQSSGTTRKRITGRKLKDLPVRIPPAAEQQRIASKIDELFSRINEGERALQRVEALTERYRQSALKAAVAGDLTHEWRKKTTDRLESGDVLLSRILKSRREAWENAEREIMKARGITPTNDKWKLKYEEPVAPETGALPELPFGWIWVSMDMLTRDFITGPFGSTLHKSDYVENGIPLVNPVNLRGGVITPDASVSVSKSTLERLSRYRLETGDIVLARRGEMGRCATVTRKEHHWMCGTGSAILRCTESVLPEFAALAISSAHSRKFLEENCAGTTMHNLNQDAMARVPIPICSLQEQAAVVEILRIQLASVQLLEASRASEQRRSTALRQVILRSAFNGTLINQNPKDEPATTLLERLAAKSGSDNNSAKHNPKKKCAT